MHYILKMFVVADDEEHAFKKAVQAYDRLIEMDDGGWDYYTLFNGPGDGSFVSGTNRWGEQKNPLKLMSTEWYQLRHEIFKYMENDFEYNVDKIRVILNTHTNRELYKSLSDYKHKRDGLEKELCYVCRNKGHSCTNFLSYIQGSEYEYDVGNNVLFGMDEWSEDDFEVVPIYNEATERNYLEGKEKDKIWIVLADMHR